MFNTRKTSMSTTNATATEVVAVQPSTKITAAINACIKADVARDIAIDNYRNVAKSEAVRLSLTDRKALTAVLFASGDKDARRVSEIVGFVFPANDSARKELDKAMEHNATQTDPKKRIKKDVILALQRDKEGTLTLKAALEAAKKKETLTRQPGGSQNQTEKKKPLTAKEQEEEIETIISSLVKKAVQYEYDEKDIAQMIEDAFEAVAKADAEAAANED